MAVNLNQKVGIYTCSQNETLKPCNIVSVQIGNKMFKALIDSGAVISLIKPSIAEGFNIGNNIENSNLVDIQGNSIPTYGKVDLPVRFIQGETVQHEFVIVDTISFRADLLLGIDFLHRYNIKIDWGNGCMYAFEKEIVLEEEQCVSNEIGTIQTEVKQLRREIREIRQIIEQAYSQGSPVKDQLLLPITTDDDAHAFGRCLGVTHSNGSEETLDKKPKETAAPNVQNKMISNDLQGRKVFKMAKSVKETRDLNDREIPTRHCEKEFFCVQLDKDMFLPPRSIIVCEAALRGSSRVKAQHVVLEQCEDAPHGLLVARILCKSDNRVPVRLTNVADKEILVQRNTTVALAYEADVEEKPTRVTSNTIRSVTQEDSDEILKELSLKSPKTDAEIKLKNLVLEYIDIFRAPSQKLTCTSQVTHRIITDNVSPICKRPYRVPFHRQAVLKKEIQKLLDDGVIQESESPWSFPAILIEKRKHPNEDVQYRLCIDYRELNNITKTDYFPLPNIHETIDQLAGSSLFSTMDLASGYFQVPLHPSDREKSAFSTPDNHYEFTRMAMGLKNAPATWSRMMSHIFSKLNFKECLLYLDDIIVFSINDIDIHLERLRHVFDKMRASNLKFKPTKCHFLKKETEYLGHVIKEGGYTTNPEKTHIIQHYPVPKTVKEIRAFLGLCGFYRKFVPDFSKISQPLTELTKKNTPYRWTVKQEEAFETLKNALITPPILRYPDFRKEFIVNTDASATAISAILTQSHEGVEHPICYSSRTLNAAERRYSTIERECLAVVYAVKTYRVYLTGTHFTIITDHRPLKYLLTIKDPSSRLSKWAMFLMEYSFTIQYRPGRMNSNVDGLTRLRPVDDKTSNFDPKPVAFVTDLMEPRPMKSVVWTTQELKRLQTEDLTIQNILLNVDNENGLYYRSENGLIYKSRQHEERHDRLVAPLSIINDILQIYHSSILGAHPGQKKTCQSIQQDFYWKSLKQDVKNFVEKCHSCNTRKVNPQLPVEMQRTPVPSTPWSRISIDIVGPLNPTTNGNKYLLTCIDFLTRYPECVPLKDIRASTVAKAFVESIILKHGAPRELLSDLGTQFTGQLFENICKLLDIQKLRTTPYHPAGNGMIERMHKTLKTMISHFTNEHQYDWDEILPYALLAYRNQRHEATQETPFFLMFGRDMELPVHLTIRNQRTKYDLDENYATEFVTKMQVAHEKAKQNIENSIEKRCYKFNDRKLRNEYQVGDLVYTKVPHMPTKTLARKFLPKWKGPYRIIAKKGPVTFKIREVGGKKEQMIHAEKLKIFKGSETLEQMASTSDAVEKINKIDEDIQDHVDEYIQNGQELRNSNGGATSIIGSSGSSSGSEDDEGEEDLETESETEVYDDDPTVDILVNNPAIEGDHAEDLADKNADNISENAPQVPIKRTRTREVKLPTRFKDFTIE